MASKIESFDFSSSNAKYDWTSWLDGDIWQLVQGVDFKVKMSSMRAIVNGRAGARELKVHTSVDGKTLTIQAYKA
jgi:hypothetical protein